MSTYYKQTRYEKDVLLSVPESKDENRVSLLLNYIYLVDADQLKYFISTMPNVNLRLLV